MSHTERFTSTTQAPQSLDPQPQQGPQLLEVHLLTLVGGGTDEPPALPKEESPKGGW